MKLKIRIGLEKFKCIRKWVLAQLLLIMFAFISIILYINNK
nr:MAG TPA: chitin synthase regulator [Caudoviricetes sp.]